MKDKLAWLARVAVARPALTLAIVAAVALGGGLLALGLQPSAADSTFVSSASRSYRATFDDYRHFGAEPVVILVHEPLTYLVETKDLATLTQLEACLAGQVVTANPQLYAFTPAAAGSASPYGGASSPCGQLMRDRYTQVVYGPGTFLNRAVAAVNEEIINLGNGMRRSIAQAESAAYQLALAKHLTRPQALTAARAAGTLARQQALTQVMQLYLNSGISGTPRIDDPQFIPEIVFDQTRGVNQPKARFAYLFPTKNSALIQVRLRAGLSTAQQAKAIALIRAAVQMPQFHLAIGSGTYTVSGAPVVVAGLTSHLSGAILGLLIGALIVMALVLLLVFRSRLRLLPLAIALAAAGITFGIMELAGATLTMASIAVLPILIGLGVDYAVQFQSRTAEARAHEPPVHAGAAERAVAHAASVGAPAIAVAALATATGFLALLLSPVPMVRGFGLLLIVGIAIALICTLLAGPAALALAERDGGPLGASLRGAGELIAALGRPAGRRLRSLGHRPASSRGAAGPSRSLRWIDRVTARPLAVIAVGAVVAIAGWAADTGMSVQSDITKLVPSNLSALRDLRQLERVTGVSGEIDVTVHASNVATPATVGWMVSYEQSLLAHFGYLETKGCQAATLCPALSLPDLFSSGGGATQSSVAALSQSSITSLLAAVPSYFSQAVITPDHREATLAFGIRLMPLARQQGVIDYMRSRLHPPPGVTAQLAGLPVLAAEANAALSSSGRRLLTLVVGLLAVALVLLLVLRRVERALVPLVPIALATGWSALILFLLGIPLNPMSATLGALVIAISTEFSVLLSERFRQERAAGRDLAAALEQTYRSTGSAVLTSGLTAIAGFAVLVVSDITMLRDFGLVTLVDLTVSLAGVLLLLPAVLAVAERGDLPQRLRTVRRRPPARGPRRRARVAA